ncbi:MAG: M23 family metallopeptidase [Bacteroidota bacterium]|nr:M23 family metallopeptidase [Bacteroidota bacterium]
MKIRFLIFAFIIVHQAFAQNTPYPQGDFVAPVKIPIYLSGTFGELRGQHFHSGIDIKTNGKKGIPIIAIADGYVTRIKVSPGGFGKALYIAHPNGYSSVYAHLQSFMPGIQEYVIKNQYELESFPVNLFPDQKMFKVKQGDTIALSGNSGSSLGPHLHFEIRETEREVPVNPLFFNFEIKDYVRPRIKAIQIYPYDHFSRLDGRKESIKLRVAGWGEKHRLEKEKLISVSGNVYFGIETDDQLNDMPNRNGVYSVELFVDSSLVYSTRMDKFSFYETRYINSLIDYAEYTTNKDRFQKSLIEPNNKLSVYKNVNNNGVITFNDSSLHRIEYIVRDAYGNVSRLEFPLRSIPVDSSAANYELEEGTYFSYVLKNEFTGEGFRLSAPPGAFYSSFFFTWDTLRNDGKYFSNIHQVHNENVAIHDWIVISIKADTVPLTMQEKLLVVKLNAEGEMSPAGGFYKDGWMTSSIRDFGNYTVGIDTIPPEIRALNVYDNKNIQGYPSIRISIKDDLSGIKDYRASLNGQWILMEYDPKNDLLEYFVDSKLQKGKNAFSLEVKDERGNRSQINYTFINK